MSNSIDQLEQKLKAVLEGEPFSSAMFDGKTAKELLLELSVYHQELEFQNDELRRVQLDLEEAKEFYTDLFEHAPVNYVLYDQDLLIQRANKSCRETLIVGTGKLEGQKMFQFIHPDSQDAFYLHLKAVENKAEGESCSLDLVRTNQKPLRVKMQSNRVTLANKTMIRSAFIDISREHEQQRKIEYLTFRDILTGLYNRTYFEHVHDWYASPDSLPLGIIVSDMNALKLVNDTFGHEMGDALLVALAKVLQQHCPADGLVFRIGGDEFLYLLPHITSEKLLSIIKQIEQQCNAIKVGSIQLSASFGHALRDSVEASLESVVRHAEDLMYQNKLFASKTVRQSLVYSLIDSLFAQHEEQRQFANLSRNIAKQMASCLNLSAKQREDLVLSAYVHDIGKLLSVSDEVIEEHSRRHPEKGYRVLCSLDDQHVVAETVLYHHERWDGGGFPLGLKGESIPLLTRILTLVDVIAWYIASNPKDEVKTYIQSLSGSVLDPHLVGVVIEAECI
nr:diguanylate cyclase [uncultured Sphaerochaeta sp.]